MSLTTFKLPTEEEVDKLKPKEKFNLLQRVVAHYKPGQDSTAESKRLWKLSAQGQKGFYEILQRLIKQGEIDRSKSRSTGFMNLFRMSKYLQMLKKN